jgi:hypothetical protein
MRQLLFLTFSIFVATTTLAQEATTPFTLDVETTTADDLTTTAATTDVDEPVTEESAFDADFVTETSVEVPKSYSAPSEDEFSDPDPDKARAPVLR